MSCVCERLYYSMFENVFRCNIITSKQRNVLNGFINVSKSRKSHVFYQERGDLLIWGQKYLRGFDTMENGLFCFC